MKARIVHNLKKRNGSEASPAPGISPYMNEKKAHSVMSINRPLPNSAAKNQFKHNSMLPPPKKDSFLDRSTDSRMRHSSLESSQSG